MLDDNKQWLIKPNLEKQHQFQQPAFDLDKIRQNAEARRNRFVNGVSIGFLVAALGIAAIEFGPNVQKKLSKLNQTIENTIKARVPGPF